MEKSLHFDRDALKYQILNNYTKHISDDARQVHSRTRLNEHDNNETEPLERQKNKNEKIFYLQHPANYALGR